MQRVQISRRIIAASLLGVGLLIVMSIPYASAGGRTSGVVNMTLTQVQEIRRADLIVESDAKSSFDMNAPRLELTFSLVPPKSKNLVEVIQPERIRAADSEGRDLTAVKPNVFGRKQFVQLVQTWNGPAETLTLTLGLPVRSASTFDLDADFGIWAYDTIKELTVVPGTEGTTLEGPWTRGEKVVVRLRKSRNGVDLEVRPGTLKRHIESVDLFDGDTKLTGQGTMWSEQVAAFRFKGEFKPTLSAKIKARVGMEKLPCRVTLAKQPLP